MAQLSRSESSASRYTAAMTPRTPHTPLDRTADNTSEDSNPVPTIYRCRAPIASLDCMDEFSANSQQMLDQMARHVSAYMGNHTTMPSSVTPGLRYKNLGKSGLRVPNVALGLWSIYGPQVPEEISEDMINYALDSGINMFDLSEAHSAARAETEFGRTLKKRGTKRASIIITTKIYWSTKSDERGLSRKHIIESVKASLARLQVEYIDVVLLHKVDPMCPMEEMVRTMKFIINQGWAMYWGTARWSPTEIMEAYTNCRQFNCITPIVEQTEYHMFCREKVELYLPELYHKIGVGMMVWSAITTGKGMGTEDMTALFAKSRFNRKYSTFSWCEEDVATTAETRSIVGSKEAVTAEEPRTYGDKLRDLAALAANLNCSLRQMAIAWCLKNEMVNCVLLGASNVAQLKENIDALQVVPQLTSTVMEEIEQVLTNKPVRPPMVSTLAMRTQMQAAAATALANSNSVHVDLTGASTAAVAPGGVAAAGVAGSPKPESAGETHGLEAAEASSPETEHGTTEVVVSVSSLKGKQPASGGSKVKKSKSEMVTRTRSSSIARSTSGQLSAGAGVTPAASAAGTAGSSRDRRRSRFDLASPSPCDV